MAAMLEKMMKFINYWYFRYLMVTEMYMVETWERVVIHVIFFLLFMGLWWFNSSVFLSALSSIYQRNNAIEDSPTPIHTG